MAEKEAGGGGSRAGSIAKAFVPHPSIEVVTFWQGIVQIVLRAVVIVLAFCTTISGAVSQNELGLVTTPNTGFEALRGRSQAAAGWIIFVCVVLMLVQGAMIAIRFLNFGFVTLYTTIVLIVDICISSGFAVALFVGAIPMAVYASDWGRFETINEAQANILNLPRIRASTGAVAAFTFFTFIAMVVLAVWMVLFLILKWSRGSSKYSGGQEAAAPS